MDTILVVACVVFVSIGALAIQVRAVRVGRRWIPVSIGWTVVAAVLIMVFLSGGLRDYILARAKGDRDWTDSELVRWLFIVLPTFVVGYWVWFWMKLRDQRGD